MIECAPDAPMNRGVNEREAFHAYALELVDLNGK